jgi:hypothetical protein
MKQMDYIDHTVPITSLNASAQRNLSNETTNIPTISLQSITKLAGCRSDAPLGTEHLPKTEEASGLYDILILRGLRLNF